MAIIINDFNKIDGFMIVKEDLMNYRRYELYRANTLCTFVYIDDNGNASLAAFFTDCEHAKRCLGLRKGYDKWSMDIKEATFINKDNGIDWKVLSALLLKAYPDIKITIINECRAL